MLENVGLEGEITHVFGHRFVLRTQTEDILADLGPKAESEVPLRVGQKAFIVGARKRSEVKVAQLSVEGQSYALDHPPAPHPRAEVPPMSLSRDQAMHVVSHAGYQIIGEPKRKPRHYEVLGRKAGTFPELHVHEDGKIRKSRPVGPGDHKWEGVIKSPECPRLDPDGREALKKRGWEI